MNVKYTISSSFQGLETPISTTPVAPTVPGALPGLNVIRRVKAPTLQAAIATAVKLAQRSTLPHHIEKPDGLMGEALGEFTRRDRVAQTQFAIRHGMHTVARLAPNADGSVTLVSGTKAARHEFVVS